MERLIGNTCEERSPWDRNNAVVNQVLMCVPVAIGTLAIARHRPLKLIYYLPGVLLVTTVWRRFVCARCQYYGQECSTLLGIATARMMPRDEEKALGRNAMMLDFALLGLLAIIPIPQVLKRSRLASLYLLSLVAFFTVILFNACGRCGNEFCPMKGLEKRVRSFYRGLFSPYGRRAGSG